jgi:hypothetical protein
VTGGISPGLIESSPPLDFVPLLAAWPTLPVGAPPESACATRQQLAAPSTVCAGVCILCPVVAGLGAAFVAEPDHVRATVTVIRKIRFMSSSIGSCDRH